MYSKSSDEICRELGIQIIKYNDERYPSLLRMIHDPPEALFVRGDLSALLEKPCVALVGARKATKDGLAVAHRLAGELAREGWTVVSGMAYGIDRAAHEGALDAGGKTVAVWGTGADIVYPRAHKNLAECIFKSGAAITEFPLGTRPAPYHFPQRNRIISGISLGVVIIEAAESSGSLITAEFALEQGRDVCAVPWNAGLVMGAGANRLIRQGAALVERAKDVIEVLSGVHLQPPKMKKSRQKKEYAVTESQPIPVSRGIESLDDQLVKTIGDEPVALDEIIQRSGLSAAEVLGKLARLQLDDVIEELPGKRYRTRS